LHLVGTTLAICFVVAGVFTSHRLLLLAGILCGYAFAWVGHFFVEHNRPATFRYPFWSFAADFKMWWVALTGRLPSELRSIQRPLTPP